jgi:hypothetical protein
MDTAKAPGDPAAVSPKPGTPVASDAEIAALKAHPLFPEACRQAAVSVITLYRGNRLFNALVNDRGRSSIIFLALYLHNEWRADDPRSGLTMSRLKSICADQNIGSPGRIETFVMLMRMFGLLKNMPSPADQRVRRLAPTERLTAMLYERWRGLLAAMTPVMPDAETINAGLSDEVFARGLVRKLGEAFLAGVRPLEDRRARELFGDRNAGLMIALSLMTAGGPAEFPPHGPVTVSISALARQFSVSRVHVRKMLRDAADDGYITRASSDGALIEVLPPLHAATLNFFANAILLMRNCARAARAEIGPPRSMAAGLSSRPR